MQSLYEKYQNEDRFREDFIKPLLVKMGFIGITNKHGAQEFGKDYVFTELDRFGVQRHMVVQAKHEKTINKGAKVLELLSQVREAFTVPFQLASAPSEIRYVSAVYVFNSGNITEPAKKKILHELEPERKVSSFFYDGHQLETLSQITTRQLSSQIDQSLSALQSEFVINAQIAAAHIKNLKALNEERETSWDVRPFLLVAVEQFLSNPPVRDRQLQNLTVLYWQACHIAMGISYSLQYKLGLNEQKRANNREKLSNMCNKSISLSLEISKHIDEIRQSIPNVEV